MSIDKSIFGLRFGANIELYPTQEELSAFLMSPKQRGRLEKHGDDLMLYSTMLEAVLAFEYRVQQAAGYRACRELMFYGVLSHSRFFSTALRSDVEYFKYHVHELLTLDFRKPAVFMSTAKDEMGRLNPRKKDDAAKLARLRAMVSEREKTLAALKKRRSLLVDELKHIARYIRDNLVKIKKHCETSIVVLVDPKFKKNEETRIVEDIKVLIQEELREVLHQGAITKRHLEAAKNDMVAVSREVSVLIREDIYTLTRLYESIYDHAKKIVHDIDTLLAEINGKQGQDLEGSCKLFAQLEQVIVSLISAYRFGLEAAAAGTESAHQNILLEKRKEMLGLIFELLRKERRSRKDRRTDAERRRFKDSSYNDAERRRGKERRTRSGRRNA